MCAQAVVLIMQRRRGPRCLVPARWLPPKHDYFKLTAAPHHRSGSVSVGSAGADDGLANAQADSSSSSSSSLPFGAAIAAYFSSSPSDSSAGSARGEYHRVNIDAFGSGGSALDDDSAIELADASSSASSSSSPTAALSSSSFPAASSASASASFAPIVEQCACCLEDLDPSLNELPFDDADFDDAADAQRAIEVVRADSIHHSSSSTSSSSSSASSSASSSSAFAFASSSTSVNSGAPAGLAFSDSHLSASASSSSSSSSSASAALSSLPLSAAEIAARRVMQTPCGHRFHAACLRQWMCAQLHQTCPTCRGFLPLE
jgi:hypothetical protein